MQQKIKFKEKFNKFTKYLKDIVFPRNLKCIFCGDELDNNEKNSTCCLCLNSLPFITNSCPKCGGVLSKEASGVCLDCKINNYQFTSALSVFEYENLVLNVIHKLKYNGKTYLIESLAKFMAQKFLSNNLHIDYLTCVPIHEEKLKLRGFNQAALLAKEISNIVKIPYLPLCIKTVNTPSQTELNFNKRKENIKDSFMFVKEYKRLISGKNILIIDDVFTTGATCNEISKVLLRAGAKQCFVLTLAHVTVNKLKQGN